MSKVSFIKTLSEYSDLVPSQDGSIITTSDKPGLAYCVGNVKRTIGSPSWGDIEVKKVPDYFFLSGKGLTDWPSAQYSLLGNAVFKDNITSYSIEQKAASGKTPNAVLCFSPMDLTSKKSINISFNMTSTVPSFVRFIVHSDSPVYDYNYYVQSNSRYGTYAATASTGQITSTASQTLSLDISPITGYWYVSLLVKCDSTGRASGISISNWTIS